MEPFPKVEKGGDYDKGGLRGEVDWRLSSKTKDIYVVGIKLFAFAVGM